MNKKIKNGLEMAAFTVPAIILVCLMMYVPFVLSGYYSLTEWNGILMEFGIPIKKKVRSVDLTSQETRQRSMQNVSLNGMEKMNKVH